MNPMLTVLRALLLPGVLVAGLSACSTAPERASHSADSPVANVRALPVYRGSDGATASWDRLVADARAADVIVVGENHGHPVGLPWAAALWEDVSAPASGGDSTAALALEFFERQDQSRMDDYLKGVTDEAAFLKRTDRKGGNYPAAHRAMVERAKALKRPVVASNAPWEIVRYLRGKDYDALLVLTPEQTRLFRVPSSPPEGRYRADYDAVMKDVIGMSHGAPKGVAPAATMTEAQKQAALDASFRTQQLWDWTMAESVTRAVDAGSHPVLQVIGRFHSDFVGGMPQAVAKLRPGTRVVVISVVDVCSAALREEDRGRGDYVVYVGPSPEDQ